MKTISSILFLAFSLTFFSCDDILEEDISDRTVTAISPQNNAIILSNVVGFQWSEISGADKYRVQVFSENQVIVIDTLVEDVASVTLPLSPGDYSWRVRGENFAYQSSYSLTNAFEVQASDDLSSQQVLLNSPSDNFYTKNQNVTLSWQALTSSDYYELQVINVSNSNTVVLQQSNLSTTSYNLNSTILSQDGNYQWKVKAYNTTTSTTTPFTTRSFNLDTVVPNQPQNTLPANNATQLANTQASFSWSIPADTGIIQSPLTYTIEIASNTSFTTIIHTGTSTSSTYSHTFTTAGDYYWRVRAKDAAENLGANSAYYKITIN